MLLLLHNEIRFKFSIERPIKLKRFMLVLSFLCSFPPKNSAYIALLLCSRVHFALYEQYEHAVVWTNLFFLLLNLFIIFSTLIEIYIVLNLLFHIVNFWPCNKKRFAIVIYCGKTSLYHKFCKYEPCLIFQTIFLM